MNNAESMFPTLTKVVKDVSTLANGDDFCVAGISTLIALALGVLVVFYVFAFIRPSTVKDIADFMQAYTIYNGGVITTGCTGKLITNKAEPNQ